MLVHLAVIGAFLVIYSFYAGVLSVSMSWYHVQLIGPWDADMKYK